MRRPTARRVVIGGIMEHIEQAACTRRFSGSLPPVCCRWRCRTMRRQIQRWSLELGVVGLDEHQLRFGAGQRAVVYVLEVNPRASRTVPFVSQGMQSSAGCDRSPLHGFNAASRRPGSLVKSRAVLFGQGSGVPVCQIPVSI